MKRVEFRLTMPGRASWNGGWSGEGKNYAIVRKLTDKRAAELFGDKDRASWGHAWSDGWFASVEGRIVPPGERLKKSDGFSGYDWMVGNILAFGSTKEPEKKLAPPPTPNVTEGAGAAHRGQGGK